MVVTDVGFFILMGGQFRLMEYFPPYTPEWIMEKTDADIVVASDCFCCKE